MTSKSSICSRKLNQKAGPSTRRQSQLGTVETSGELLGDGVVIELIRDAATRRLSLLKWAKGNATVASRVLHNGNTYVPLRLEPSYAGDLVLPPRVGEHTSARQLCQTLRELFTPYTDETGTWLLTIFALGTWGIDWLPFAPGLVIAGPRREAIALLRVLECVCRRSLLLAELNRRSLRMLPIVGLRPTLLLASTDPATRSLLGTCNFRGLRIPLSGGLLDLFCSTAICGGNWHRVESDNRLCVSVRPQRTLEYLDETRRQSLIDSLQPLLLRYRLALSARMLAGSDAPGRHAASAQFARSLELLIANDHEVLTAVSPLLEAQEEEIERERLAGNESVVGEAVLAACHLDKTEILVSGVAEFANAILLARREPFDLEPRAVGNILRNLGLRTERLGADGRGLKLDQKTRQTIHELARDYRVPNRSRSCPDCRNMFGEATRN